MQPAGCTRCVVKATGGEKGAGIGGGDNNVAGGEFVLYDGTVIAEAGEIWDIDVECNNGGAGVGGGSHGKGGIVIIYGGTLTATAKFGAAGIGSGCRIENEQPVGGTFSIYGGTVTAKGRRGAGIGGGYHSGGPYAFIYGGTVTATGGYLGAGIGGGGRNEGDSGNGGGCGGEVNIYGGTVTATGGDYGAGIGGGYDGNGGGVTITGGMVTAEGGKEAAGIGGGKRSADPILNSPRGRGGNVTITGGTVIAKAGGLGNGRSIGPGFLSEEYGSLDIGDNMAVAAGNNGSAESIFDADERVNACWYRSYAEISPCTHPGATYTIDGTDVNGTHTLHCSHCTTTFEAENHTFENGKCIVCGVETELNIILSDDSDNAETLTLYNGLTVNSVTLAGRTLLKDGKWNTLCLPFSLTEAQVTAQLAPYGLKMLSGSAFDSENGTLTLDFADATEIEAGKPYIVKWATTTPNYVENPEFIGVTISNATTPVETDYVDFVGNFSPIDIFTEEKINLYLGANDLLYYPTGEDMTSFVINSFRAFFQLKEGLTAGEPVSTDVQPIKSFVLNFGEETGISEISKESRSQGDAGGWYSLEGRRLEDKPTAKGLYIHNGTKILIK